MGLPTSNRAAAYAVDTSYVNFNEGTVYSLQQKIAVIAQGSDSVTYDTTKFTATSHQEVGDALGYGSPAHLCAKELLPDNGDGALGATVTIFPLPNEATGVAATGSVTPTGTQTTSTEYVIRVGGVESNSFTGLVGDTATEIITKGVTAINGVLAMPVVATDGTTTITLTAKHKGTTGNDLKIEVIGTSDESVFGLAERKMTGGLVDPDVSVATDQFGSVWYTAVVNALGESALDDLSTFGDGRYGQLVRKPFFALYGSSETDVDVLTAVGDTRKTDKVNGVIPCPGSTSAPWSIAARAIARIAKQANQNPAAEYRTDELDTLVNGADGIQWNYDERDAAWKSGVSSTQINNGVIQLDNTLLFYHPDGQVDPSYGKVIYIVKLQNIIYNIDLVFDQDSWKKAVLIPDFETSSNVLARKPSDAVAALNVLTDNLANAALISDRTFTKANTTATISSSNPNRVNTSYPVKLSGNWDIHSVDLLFGFYLGGS